MSACGGFDNSAQPLDRQYDEQTVYHSIAATPSRSFHLTPLPLSYAQAASLSPSGSAGAKCTFPPHSLMPVTSQHFVSTEPFLAAVRSIEPAMYNTGSDNAVWASQTLPQRDDVHLPALYQNVTAPAWSLPELSSATPRPFINFVSPLFGSSGGPAGNRVASLTGHLHDPIVAADRQTTEAPAEAALGSGERSSFRQRHDTARPQKPEPATHREFAAVNAGAATAGDWPARQYIPKNARGRPAPAEAAGIVRCGGRAEELSGGLYGSVLASASTPAQPAPPAGAAVSAAGEADWQPSSRSAGEVSSADDSKAGLPPDDSDSERTAGLDPGQRAAASRLPPGAESDPFHDDYPYW